MIQVKKISLVICLLFFGAFQVFAQDYFLLSGRVVDRDNKAIPNVQVSISGVSKIYSTDSLGEFNINLEARSNIVVTFFHLAYQYQVIELNPKKSKDLKIVLSPLVFESDTVIVNEDKSKKTGTVVEIKTKTLKNIVSANGDGLSVVKSLASVSSNSELSSAYSVRGGNFDENLIYVNGIQVFRPFLVRSGEQEGLSFVNSDLIQSITFSAGGFQAKYGDKMSSVLDIQYKEPTEFKSSVNLSLLGFRAHTEGRIKKLSYIMGYRYRSNSYLLGTLETEGEFRPQFMDFQSYISYRPVDKLKIGYLTNVSSNVFEMVPVSRSTKFGGINNAFQLLVAYKGKERSAFNTSFNALSFDYIATDNLILKLSASHFYTLEEESFDVEGSYRLGELETSPASDNFGEINTLLGTGSFLDHARNFLTAEIFNINHDGIYIAKWGKVLWGGSYQKELIQDDIIEWEYRDSSNFTIPTNSDDIEVFNYQNNQSSLMSNRYSGYLQSNLDFFKSDNYRSLELIGGVRSQWWDYNEELLISPRASLLYSPRKSGADSIPDEKSNFTYRLAWGVYYQSPLYRDLRNLEGELQEGLLAQKSVHYVAGMDYDFSLWDRPFTLRNEVYYKQLSNLIPFEVENVRVRYFGENSGTGYATGVESRINGEFIKGLESWMSIAIMETKERIKDYSYFEYYNQSGEKIKNGYTLDNIATDSAEFSPGILPRPTDQRFNIKVFFQDQMPKTPQFKVHLNFVYAAGLPFSPPNSVKNRNALRMPPYRRVDVGFSWFIIEDGKKVVNKTYQDIPTNSSWRFFKDFWIRAEVFNLLNINNTISYLWVSDVFNRQYAVPNFLTQRLINIKMAASF